MTATKEKTILAWHFSNADCTLGNGDGRKIVAGETLRVDGTPVLCKHGLHASIRPIDALKYAPGPYLWRVRIGGDIKQADDKIVGNSRKALWGFDATDLLRTFARRCALDVAHLWVMPSVVRRYLETGDESIRASARDAARAAAGAAARAAAGAAARGGRTGRRMVRTGRRMGRRMGRRRGRRMGRRRGRRHGRAESPAAHDDLQLPQGKTAVTATTKPQSDRKRKMYADRRAKGWHLMMVWFPPEAWTLLQRRRAENPDLNIDQVIERHLKMEG